MTKKTKKQKILITLPKEYLVDLLKRMEDKQHQFCSDSHWASNNGNRVRIEFECGFREVETFDNKDILQELCTFFYETSEDIQL